MLTQGPLARFARRRLLPRWRWFAAGTLALAVTNGITAEIPLVAAHGIDALGEHPDVSRNAALLAAALGVVVFFARTASRMLFFTPGRDVEAELKVDVFAALLRQRSAFVRSFPAGDLVARMNGDIGNLRLLAGFIALGMVNTVTAFALTGVQMARLSPPLAAWTLVALALGFTITVVTARRLHGLMHRLQAASSDMADQALTSLQGVPGLSAWGAEDASTAALLPKAERWRALQIERSLLRIAFGPALGLATATSVFAALWTAAGSAQSGALSAGELIAFVALAGGLAGPLRAFSFTVSLLRSASASVERIDALIDAPVERPDLPDPEPAPVEAPAIRLRKLTVRYPGADRDALSHVDLDIPAGATVGIVGATGCGKSTLAAVLARQIDPPPGAVLIDGVDLRRIDLDRWRDRLVLVSQRPFLFSESVRDNVSLGHDVDVDALVTAVALRPDVAAWPDGLDTVVGERGLTLSGGQRQRVALARALARQPAVLVLDDVLSAVDAPTARRLLDTLRNAARRPTTLIVSHRLDAVRDADVIGVLDDGHLVDAGRHDELMLRCAAYRDLFDRQRHAEAAA